MRWGVRRLGMAVAVAGLLAASPLAAREQPLVSSWTAPEMKTLVGSMAGLSVVQVDALDNGDPFLIIRAGAGTNFALYGAACAGTPARCRGVSLVAFVAYDSAAKAQAARTRLDYPAVSIRQDDPRTLSLTRYVILDEGIHRKNLEANIRLFTAILSEALALR